MFQGRLGIGMVSRGVPIFHNCFRPPLYRPPCRRRQPYPALLPHNKQPRVRCNRYKAHPFKEFALPVSTNCTPELVAEAIQEWKGLNHDTLSIKQQNVGNLTSTKVDKLFNGQRLEGLYCMTETGLGGNYPEGHLRRDLEMKSKDIGAFFQSRKVYDRRSGGLGVVFDGEEYGSKIKYVDTYDELDWILPVMISLTERRDPLAVVVCYIAGGSPPKTRASFFSMLHDVYLDLQKNTSGVIIIGDFNVRIGQHQGCASQWIVDNFPRKSQDSVKMCSRSIDPLVEAGAIVLSGRLPGDLEGRETNYHNRDCFQGTLIDEGFASPNAFADLVKCKKGKVDRSISSHVLIDYSIIRTSFCENLKYPLTA